MPEQQDRVAFYAVIPIFISLSMISAISLVDIYLAGLLGPAAQAALGIADQIVFLNMLLMNGFCAGVNALVSRSCGAGDLIEARLYMKHSMIASAGVGTLATILGVLVADTIAAAFAADQQVRQQAAMYIKLIALGNLPWALVMCQGAIFRASGQARLGVAQWFIIMALCIGCEVIAFFLVQGCRSLVPLAVAWDLSVVAGYLIGARSLGKLLQGHNPFSFEQFVSHARSVFAIGIPVMVGDMCWLISNLMLFSLLALLPHPTAAEAAWTLQLKIEEAIAYVPLMACCQATAVLVGNCVGAGDARGARQIARRLARAAVVTMFAVGCATALTAPYAAQLASGDAEVRRLATQLLIGSIVTFPLNALALVLASALEGAGATRSPMVVNIVGLILVRLPVAWCLSLPLGFGVAGVWIARSLSNLITSFGMVRIFKRSNWLEMEADPGALSPLHLQPISSARPTPLGSA